MDLVILVTDYMATITFTPAVGWYNGIIYVYSNKAHNQILHISTYEFPVNADIPQMITFPATAHK